MAERSGVDRVYVNAFGDGNGLNDDRNVLYKFFFILLGVSRLTDSRFVGLGVISFRSIGDCVTIGFGIGDDGDDTFGGGITSSL